MSSWQPPHPATHASVEELDDFAAVRRDLNELVRWQQDSVLYFDRLETSPEDSAGPGSFYRTVEEQARKAAASGSRLTTTITCIESLIEVPSWLADKRAAATAENLLERLEAYIAPHLTSDNVSAVWKSDDAAWVYCRVRSLGSYLRMSQAVRSPDYPYKSQVLARAGEAWSSRYSGGASFGLREATVDVSKASFSDVPQLETSDQQYPPNAYLTYWGLLTRRGLISAGHSLPEGAADEPLGDRADHAAREWLADNLARQVVFHYNGSASADPQQLLWSICGLVRFAHGPEAPGLSRHDTFDNVRSVAHELLVGGLQAFFDQMQPNGDWATGAPLFHYRTAGNAYSYIYEALGELFSLACAGEDQVPPAAAAALRRELRPHWAKIKILLARARELGQSVEKGVIVWSSGHHPHRSAESWATASVFRMMQSLRRLIGTWCSEETKQLLGARKPRQEFSGLMSRGDTWDTGSGSVGLYLRLAFLWPIKHRLEQPSDAPVDRLFASDPDQPLLATDDQARSAILFGPPGTGKTFMVEALAGALGWEFIEITPARFIDEGVDRVSARADHIFRQIMEVDRCVVLLDEIDELIRLRGQDSDPLERFFTTTMLPRLAALWALGRVIFFVNTNDIERVDTAIRRAQRFDSALLVLPPNYRTKQQLLKAEYGIDLPFTEEDVTSAIAKARAGESTGSGDGFSVNPGWLALMRFDQIGTFASKYKQIRADKGGAESRAAAAQALDHVARELLELDWLPLNGSQKDTEQTPEADLRKLPPLLGRLLGAERRDGRRRLMWLREDGIYVTLPSGIERPDEWRAQNGFAVQEDSGVLVAGAPAEASPDTPTEEPRAAGEAPS